MRMAGRISHSLAVLLCLSHATGVSAQGEIAPSSAISFQIGSGQSICTAQDAIVSKARGKLFDRSWTIICRDATRPVGQIHVLRRSGDLATRIAGGRLEPLRCGEAGTEAVKDLGSIQIRNCRSDVSTARWKSYAVDRGGRHYVVEGVVGYDEALRLALRSVVADRVIAEPVAVLALDSEAGASFYRLQSGQTDVSTRLEQGYRSNNAGAFAEAVEYFDLTGASLASTAVSADDRAFQHEMLVNRAIQLSNLGKFAEADAGFDRAEAMRLPEPVQTRLARNLEALHAINQGLISRAQARLDKPVPQAPTLAANDAAGAAQIANALNTPLGAGSVSAGGAFALANSLTPGERAALLDVQAAQLMGTVLRLSGEPDAALAQLDNAIGGASGVREGRVTAAYRLRAQIMTEKALIFETKNRLAEAEDLLRQVDMLVRAEYPESQATQGSSAALAAFLARHGREDDALTLYRRLAGELVSSRSRLVGLTNRIAPYFDLLAKRIPSNPTLVGDMLMISQALARPGAAATLEQLSRQMESGDDRGSALYRQSVGLRREIERNLILIAQMGAAPNAAEPARVSEIALLRAKVDQLSALQVRTLDDLAGYPQFRAITSSTVTLQEMLALLKPGEAYMKIAAIGDMLYALYLSPGRQTAWKLPMGARALAGRIGRLRDSISLTINGVQTTYPFDVDAARALYLDLFGPVHADLASVSHLIFEPDGALLQLPVNLLISDQAGVDAYHARMKLPDADDYDFTGIGWFGRERAISTALSAASFRDVRRLTPSSAKRAYLGLGQNAPVSLAAPPAGVPQVRGLADSASTGGNASCDWPLEAWNNPIAASELQVAANVYGADGADLLTGAAFTDTAILNRSDLSDFRVIHFATHGLVSAPRRSCQAKPALLTSFGPQGSDGLLEFREIFDLHLNADLVLLSACDTASGASEAATREAGIETGGGTALDGLVRAFIGAGSRTVIASHWPAPDEFDATYRLMSGLLGAPRTESLGEALRNAERRLMDDRETSHPFYWSGFALIGDGAQPVPGSR